MPGYCMAGTLRNGGGLLIVSTVQRRSWHLCWRELCLYSSTPLIDNMSIDTAVGVRIGETK